MNETIAIVTGGSRGLGAAMVKKAQNQGLFTYGISRSSVSTSTETACYVSLDLSNGIATEEWIASEFTPLLKKGGESILLINNAGQLGAMGRKSNETSLVQTFKINLFAPLALTRALLDHSTFQKNTVVNISSGAADNAYPGWLEYCSSKAALKMASQVIAKEFKEDMYPDLQHLQVIDYAPGVVDTGMQDAIRSEHKSNFPNQEKFVELKKSGRLITADESVDYLFKKLAVLEKDGYHAFRYGD